MDDRVRMVLKPAVTRDDFETFTYREDWTLVNLIQETEQTPFELVYEAEGAEVHYIDDPMVHLRYLLVRGGQTATVVERLQAKSLVYTEAEVRDAVASAKSKDERIHAVYLVCVTAPPRMEPDRLRTIERLLADSDPEVRRAVLLGAGYVEWPELKPLLERVKAEDPEAGVRDRARIILEGLEQVWKPGG